VTGYCRPEFQAELDPGAANLIPGAGVIFSYEAIRHLIREYAERAEKRAPFRTEFLGAGTAE
jgi:hypothetical protein